MSGVAVIRYLLAHNAPLLAQVPEERIVAGELPIDSVLPAISVKQVSSVPRNIVSMSVGHRQHTDRVQVSVLVKGTEGTPAGAGYPGQRTLLALVLAACPHTRGVVNGTDVDSIIPDAEGPDFADLAVSLNMGSRDFIVKWNE